MTISKSKDQPRRPVASLLTLVMVWLAGHSIDAQAPGSVVDEIFSDLAATHSPGCSVGVLRQGEVELARGYGMASLEHGLPNDENTAFYVGSVSKQFVAAAVAQAAAEGHLSLGDRVSQWFPELAHLDADASTPMTIRHLVHHTSGLRDYLGLMSLAGVPFESVITPQWVLELIARQESLNFPPGEQYLYSNSGYFLMAQLIERATGQTLREYSDTKFFRPLGMRNTHFHDDRGEVVVRRALAYSRGDTASSFRVNWSPAFDQVGSGGLVTTVRDLVEWERSYWDGRLGEGFWPQLLERGVLSDGTALDYGFGVVVDEESGRRRIQHGGGMFGYRSQLTRYPDDELSVIVLCNLSDADPSRRATAVVNSFLPQKTVAGSSASAEAATARTPSPERAVELDREQKTAWFGEYELFPGVAATIGLDSGRLYFESSFGKDERALLVPTSATTAILKNAPDAVSAPEVRLLTREEGPAIEIHLFDEQRIAPRLAPRVTQQAGLYRWQGQFQSAELDATARLRAGPSRLELIVGNAEPRELTVRKDGTASVPGLKLLAEPATGEAAVGAFTIDAGRVRGIRFERIGANEN